MTPSRKKYLVAGCVWIAVVAMPLAAVLLRSRLPGALAARYLLSGRGGAPCGVLEVFRAASRKHAELRALEPIKNESRLVTRDSAGLSQWGTPMGKFWVPGHSEGALFFDLAETQCKIYGDGGPAVHKGDVVLDCGANIGLFTKEALSEGAALVVAIEPVPENVECLRRNLANEIAAGRVIIYPKGVWDKDDILEMHINLDNAAAASFIRTPDGSALRSLPLTTIDKLVSELRLARVDFIKMDIEGAEPRALAGARQTLIRDRPRMAVCVYHLPGDPERVREAARAAFPGYQVRDRYSLFEDLILFNEVEYFQP